MSTDENKFQRVEWTDNGWQPGDDDDEHGLPVQPPPRLGLSADDLELLTLAAKAIGARAEPVDGEQWVNLHMAEGRIVYGWNSLQFSGDAFELQVELRLAVKFVDYGRTAFASCHASGIAAEEDAQIERSAALRRAITRAAAVIGKQRT